jgi:hypothetical protein
MEEERTTVSVIDWLLDSDGGGRQASASGAVSA